MAPSARSHRGRDAASILLVRDIFGRPAQRDRRQGLGLALEQRLQRVLRDQLIGLERGAAVGGGADRRLGLGDGRVGVARQRRLREIEHDINVHRHVAAQAGSADLLGEPHAPVHLHGAGVDALHLRQERRRVLLLHQDRANAALAEIDGERQADRPCANNENLRIVQTDLRYLRLVSAGSSVTASCLPKRGVRDKPA